MATFSFPWPGHRPRRAIVPVFLPFAGCPVRCLYCAQTLQTAHGTAPVQKALEEAGLMLEERFRRGLEPAEAAFYGGTFTAQKEGAFALCLAAAEAWLARGIIAAWRCSTRPDSLGGDCLERMISAGCHCVELGVQSFSDAVLEASGRGYDGRTAEAGMRKVRAAGLQCGAQLLPGLPGNSPAGFLDDVRRALDIGCDLMRFYPCLVVRSTGLARLYEEGRYRPWNVDETVEALARGLVLAHRAGVPVIRLGVAHEAGFEEHVLAGPRDPDLGSKVRSRALLLALREALPKNCRCVRATLPAAVQGYLYGHRGQTAPELAALGIRPASVVWHDRPLVLLETEERSMSN